MMKNRLNPRFFAFVRIITAVILTAVMFTACVSEGGTGGTGDIATEAPMPEYPSPSEYPSPPEDTPAAPSGIEPTPEPMFTDCQFVSTYRDEEYTVWNQEACIKGLTVAMPNSQEGNRPVDLEWVAESKGSDGFQLNRPIINFEVLNPDDAIVSEFGDQPVRLYIAVTGSDVASIEEDFNALVYAYLNEKTNTWIRFSDVENGYSLLRREGDDAFVIWQDNTWVPLTEDNGRYYFGKQEILADQLKFAFDSLSSIPEFFGVAFVYIQGWGDRHIGAGE